MPFGQLRHFRFCPRLGVGEPGLPFGQFRHFRFCPRLGVGEPGKARVNDGVAGFDRRAELVELGLRDRVAGLLEHRPEGVGK